MNETVCKRCCCQQQRRPHQRQQQKKICEPLLMCGGNITIVSSRSFAVEWSKIFFFAFLSHLTAEKLMITLTQTHTLTRSRINETIVKVFSFFFFSFYLHEKQATGSNLWVKETGDWAKRGINRNCFQWILGVANQNLLVCMYIVACVDCASVNVSVYIFIKHWLTEGIVCNTVHTHTK